MRLRIDVSSAFEQWVATQDQHSIFAKSLVDR